MLLIVLILIVGQVRVGIGSRVCEAVGADSLGVDDGSRGRVIGRSRGSDDGAEAVGRDVDGAVR